MSTTPGPLPLWRDDAGRSWWGSDELTGDLLLAWRDAAVAADRERIKGAVTRLTLSAGCPDDPPEVDAAVKSLAFTILAAVSGYEAPPILGSQAEMFAAIQALPAGNAETPRSPT